MWEYEFYNNITGQTIIAYGCNQANAMNRFNLDDQKEHLTLVCAVFVD